MRVCSKEYVWLYVQSVCPKCMSKVYVQSVCPNEYVLGMSKGLSKRYIQISMSEIDSSGIPKKVYPGDNSKIVKGLV